MGVSNAVVVPVVAAKMLVDVTTAMEGLFLTDSRGSGDNDDHVPAEGALTRTDRQSPWKLFKSLHK